MNIGEAAAASGVSAKMIRHYEARGLVPPPPRSDAGYRRYAECDVETLRFVRSARGLGFSIEEIGHLLSLWQDRRRSSRAVKALAERHLADLDARIDEMRRMRDCLQDLARRCHGDARPDCPILETLAGDGQRGRRPSRSRPTTPLGK